MSTKLACSVVPTTEICPNCKSEMTITEVTPIFLADGFEDVTYRCKGCRLDIKRAFKRRSGAWDLVTHEAKKENCNRSHWASLTLIHERRWCSEGNPVERVPEDRE